MGEAGDFLKKNSIAIVAVGGVGLGLLLLATRSGGSASGASSSGLSAWTQAAFAAQDRQVQSGTQIQLAQINAGVQTNRDIMSFLTSLNNANASVTNTLTNANASIAINQATQAAAVQIDQANNANRLAIANVNAGVQYAQISEQWHASDNAKDAAVTSSNNAMLGSLFGAVGNVAKSALWTFGG